MANTPYEKDSNIVSNLMMTGILGAGAYTAYKVTTQENYLNDKYNSFMDYFFPEQEVKGSYLKTRILNTSKSLSSAFEYAEARQKATYQDRYRSNVEKYNAIKNVGAEAIDAKWESKAKEIFSWDMGKVKNVHGKEVGQGILDAVESLYGQKSTAVDFSGTYMNIKFGDEVVSVPTAMKNAKGDAWTVMSGKGTLYTAPWVQELEGSAGKITNAHISDWNQHILDTLSNQKRALLMANSDNISVARDVMKYMDFYEKNPGDKANEIIARLKMKVDADKAVTDFNTIHNVRRATKNIEAQLLHNEIHDLAGREKDARSVLMGNWGLYNLDKNGLSGAFGDNISLPRMSYTGDQPANAIEGSTLKALSKANQLTRQNGFSSLSGVDRGDLSGNIKDMLDDFSRNIAFIGSQGQTAKLTSSVAGAMTQGYGVDTLKSVKGYSFNKSYGMPLFWDPEVAARNPNTYNQIRHKGSMRLLTVYDNDTSQIYEMRENVSKGLKATRPFEVKIDKPYIWKGLRTEEELAKGIKAGLFPKYFINGEVFQDRTMYELYQDRELLSKVDRIEAPGTKFGTRKTGTQLKSLKELDDLEMRTTEEVSYPQFLFQDKADIANTVEYLDNMKDADFKYFMQSEEPLTKVGSSHTFRSVAQRLTEMREKKIAGKLASEGVNAEWKGIASFDFLEKVFAIEKGSDAILGKQGGELLTNIQELVMGHAAAINGVTLEGDIAEGFKKYLVNPERFSGNLTKSLNALQINQNSGSIKEQLDIFTRILGEMREHKDYSKPLTIRGSMSYDSAAKTITEQLRAGSKGVGSSWFAMKDIFPQESLYTQGFGSNMFRMNVSDNLFMMPADVLSAVSKDTLVNSRRIANEYGLYMRFDGDLASSLEKIGAPILDQSGIEEMLGGKNLVGVKDLEDPYFRLNSFLNPEINPNGFAVRNHEGKLRYFGSNLYNEIQYLSDEEKEVLQKIQRAEARVLFNARNNGGVIGKADDEYLMNNRIELGTSVKEGPVRRMGLLIEGAQLDKAYAETTLLNNKSILEKVAGHKELDNLLGFATVVDKGTMERSLLNELQEFEIMAKEKGISLTEAAREKLGAGSIFESHLDGMTTIDSKSIARQITDQSVKDYEKLTELVYGGKYDEASNLIKESGHTLVGARAPYIYSSSKFLSYGFATDKGQMDGGKFVAYGNKAQTIMNLDHDGDISTIKFFYEKGTRDSVYNRILKEQSVSHDLLNNLKAGRKSVFQSIYGEEKKLLMPGSDKLDDLVAAMGANESESALTAMITKYTAGSAHVRTKEMTSALLGRIYHDMNLTESQAIEAMISAIDMPALNIIQGSLSSKHVEKVLGGAQKIDYIVNNLGKFTKEKVLNTIVGLQGDIGALSVQNILNSTVRMYGQDAVPWLDKNRPGNIYEALETHTDLATMWKAPTENRFREAYKAIGWEDEAINEGWGRFQQSIKENNIRFTSDLPAFKRYKNMSYIEAMRDISGDPNFFGSEKSESLMKLAKNGMREGESEYEAFSRIFKDNPYFGMNSGTGLLGGNELKAGLTARRFMLANEIDDIASKIKPRHIGGALGLGLVAMTALNILGGDGTPEDINDLPSVSNPSFGGYNRSSISSPRTVSSFMGNNMSMGLLTDRRMSHQDSLQSISALFNGKINNTVSVRSDGTDPYKSDMYTYRG